MGTAGLQWDGLHATIGDISNRGLGKGRTAPTETCIMRIKNTGGVSVHYRLVIYTIVLVLIVSWQWWQVRQQQFSMRLKFNSECSIDASMDDWLHRISHQLNSMGCRQSWVMIRMDQNSATPMVITQ